MRVVSICTALIECYKLFTEAFRPCMGTCHANFLNNELSSGVQGQPGLHSKFKSNLGYIASPRPTWLPRKLQGTWATEQVFSLKENKSNLPLIYQNNRILFNPF